MRKPGGYATITSDIGVAEADTFTCAHCQFITHVKARQRPEDVGGFCTLCSGLICAKCVGKGCDPFEAKMSRMEAAYHARRSYQT